ncbi:glycosyltransferase family 4 protein [Anaeromyxobacter diazotrophicus]|uniref:Glycosyl transferase n=1 Tax=Anaeromyxobacter diazotrophicus TaxID=2590199 RepID=A0A7I9VIM2_9BACT|nr:glycosyltransferase family 4 protein [Anaeromyxobacter diazotrophicus]GEJ56256.1 glycosyl transferase [Anaeromyxobacter diazotrophicus]
MLTVIARPLRLLHVTTVPESLLFLTGQPGYLRGRGFEVAAVSSPGPALERFERAEGVVVHRVPMARAITPGRDLVALVRLVLLMRRLRPDLVDAHTPKGGLLGMLAAWLAGVPVRVYHVHGLRFLTATGLARRLLRTTERLAAALATRVLCVSRSVAELAVAEGVAPPEKVSVLLGGSINGIDAAGRFRAPSPEQAAAARAALGLPERARVLGFVGRLVREKGVVELWRAWTVLREELPDLRLVLVGPLEPQDPIPSEVVASLAGDPRVLLAGQDWDTPRYFRAMDVLALPSYREGFPVVPLEAAAMGLPVVSTRVPGCVDAVVDGVTGTLVPARDAAALTGALRAYLADPALRRRHGEAARARVLRDFAQERLWSALHDAYVEQVARAGRAPLVPAGGQG